MDGSRFMNEIAISLPFSFDLNGSVAFTSDIKKIWQDRVVLVVMTLIGERVMRPNFGTNARRATFENDPQAITLIQHEVQAGFSKWLPELSLKSVDVSIDTVESILNVTVSYSYGPYDLDTVTIQSATLQQSGNIVSEIPNVK